MTAAVLRPGRLPDGRAFSTIGFGCSSLWAKPSFPEPRAREIALAAIAQGINHFDAGPSYGDGEGERRLGRILADCAPPAPVVATKAGTRVRPGGRLYKDFSPASMEASLTGSLARLGLERVDILYLHGPAPDDLNDETLRFFEREKARGRIGLSGVNSFDARVLARCIDLPIDAIMLQYNLVDRSAEALLEPLKRSGRLVLAGTALARGAFDWRTFVPTDRRKLWYLARAAKNDPLFWLKGLRASRAIARSGHDGVEAALGFVLGHPCIDGVLFGTSQTGHLIENCRIAARMDAGKIRRNLLAGRRGREG